MIHQLVIKPEMTVGEIQKLARKLAMTGGYEVCLVNDLSTEQINSLKTKWSSEVAQYPNGSSAQKASLAGRILQLCNASQ